MVPNDWSILILRFDPNQTKFTFGTPMSSLYITVSVFVKLLFFRVTVLFHLKDITVISEKRTEIIGNNHYILM